MKNTIALLIILSLSGCLNQPFLNYENKPSPESATPNYSNIDIGLEDNIDIDTIIDEQTYSFSRQINEETADYLIDVYYPEIVYPDNDVKTAVNAEIWQLINSTINNFKDAVKEMGELPVPQMSSSLNIDYYIRYFDPNIISLYFINERYISGAAHGYSDFTVLNYDLVNKKQIKLPDLFEPDSDYLSLLSQILTDDFTSIYGEDLFYDGLEPTEANFQNFVIEQQDLLFLFPDYQILPYAFGPKIQEVYYDELSDILKIDGYIYNLQYQD